MSAASSAWQFAKSKRTFRECLKALIDEIDEEAEEGQPKRLLFMTYQLDVDLFEEKVLGWLVDSEDKSSLRSRRRCAAIEKWLREIKTTVLCDANACFVRQKRTSVFVERVNLAYGTFHPKIVLYANGNDVGMLIGSANLTHSGIGSNIESLIVLGRDRKTDEAVVRGPRLRGELARFMKAIKARVSGKDGRRRIADWIGLLWKDFTARAASGWGGVSFIWSAPHKRPKCCDRLGAKLRSSQDIYMWAPYFGLAENDAYPWPLECATVSAAVGKHDIDEAIWICPAPGRRDPTKRHVSRELYSKVLRDFGKGVWRNYRPFGRTPRFAHLKLMRFVAGDVVYILAGSHNLTRAAWGTDSQPPLNFEASILLPCESNAPWSCFMGDLPDTDFKRLLDDDFASEDSNEDETDDSARMPAISVVADWENSHAWYHLDLPSDDDDTEWILQTPWKVNGSNERIITPTSEPQDEGAVELSPLLTDATFMLRRTQDEKKWIGLVTELNADLRQSSFKTLAEFLECQLDGTDAPEDTDNDDSGDGKIQRSNGDARPELVDITCSDNEEVFEIWFDLFRAIRYLAQRIEEGEGHLLREAERLLLKKLGLLRGASVEAVRNAVAHLEDAELVRSWLLTYEICRLRTGAKSVSSNVTLKVLEEVCMQKLSRVCTPEGGPSTNSPPSPPRIIRWAQRLLDGARRLEKRVCKQYQTEEGQDA